MSSSRRILFAILECHLSHISYIFVVNQKLLCRSPFEGKFYDVSKVFRKTEADVTYQRMLGSFGDSKNRKGSELEDIHYVHNLRSVVFLVGLQIRQTSNMDALSAVIQPELAPTNSFNC